ncbi:hypothetical protein OIE75_35355 [Streptomyces sp. NBC_01723]|uniref:hypothetical protein n=1 Tax=Streptomyces sp. NBC_01723 TaxID=2975921 RepID=UPI002E36C674|nr:hypothetical protein [Streptomyces sp. NBC_01723]
MARLLLRGPAPGTAADGPDAADPDPRTAADGPDAADPEPGTSGVVLPTTLVHRAGGVVPCGAGARGRSRA